MLGSADLTDNQDHRLAIPTARETRRLECAPREPKCRAPTLRASHSAFLTHNQARRRPEPGLNEARSMPDRRHPRPAQRSDQCSWGAVATHRPPPLGARMIGTSVRVRGRRWEPPWEVVETLGLEPGGARADSPRQWNGMRTPFARLRLSALLASVVLLRDAVTGSSSSSPTTSLTSSPFGGFRHDDRHP